MESDYRKKAEIAMIELFYAHSEIAQSKIFTTPIMQALEHIENAIALLQSTEPLEKRVNTQHTEAA